MDNILVPSSTVLNDKPVACGMIHNGTDIIVFDCRVAATARLCILVILCTIIVLCCMATVLRTAVKARLRKQKQRVFVVDAPPSYTDIMPPSYEWAIEHMSTKKLFSPTTLRIDIRNASLA